MLVLLHPTVLPRGRSGAGHLGAEVAEEAEPVEHEGGGDVELAGALAGFEVGDGFAFVVA